MRLLFLTSRLPYPPDRGDRLRTYQFLEQFSQDHAITLVSFIASNQESQFAIELEPFCEAMHLVSHSSLSSLVAVATNLWHSLPLQLLYYRSQKMSQLIDRLVATRAFDAAYIHLFRMAPYMIHHQGLYRITDLTDLISMELRASLPYESALWRALYQVELPRIVRYEQSIADWSDEIWFISERDRRAFTAGGNAQRLSVVPNTVDEVLWQVEASNEGPPVLLFVGNLAVKHNVDAVNYLLRDIMPLVWNEHAGCLLRIVGAGGRRSLEGLAEHPGIQFAGYVKDLASEFAASSLAVAPLRFSAGVQNKVIEAMAAGLPVVTSGAVSEGLGTVPERDLLVGDDPQSFAAHVGQLLQDAAYRQRLGQAGRTFAKTHFSAQFAAERLRVIAKGLQDASR